MTVCRANDTSVQPQLLHAMGAARSDPRRGSNPMERCNQPPPDDFPRLWGVEDKLGLYIPKQKGVLALEGELDISPRRYLSGKEVWHGHIHGIQNEYRDFSSLWKRFVPGQFAVLSLNSRKINQRIFFLMIMFKIIFVLWHAQNFLTTCRMRCMC